MSLEYGAYKCFIIININALLLILFDESNYEHELKGESSSFTKIKTKSEREIIFDKQTQAIFLNVSFVHNRISTKNNVLILF